MVVKKTICKNYEKSLKPVWRLPNNELIACATRKKIVELIGHRYTNFELTVESIRRVDGVYAEREGFIQ